MANNPYTEQIINGARFSGALINLGTEALRKELDDQVQKSTHADLQAALNAYCVKSLIDDYYHGTKGKPKILKKDQYNLLYPPGGGNPDIMDYDITLLTLILKDILKKIATTGVRIIPCRHCSTYERMKDDLEKIRVLRNTVYGHVSSTAMTEIEFQKNFSDLRHILMRFGISHTEICKWEKMTLSPDEVNIYEREIHKLCTNDITFKNAVQKISEENKQILKTVNEVNLGVKRLCNDVNLFAEATKKQRTDNDEELTPQDYWPYRKEWDTTEECDVEKDQYQYWILKYPLDPERCAMICKHHQTKTKFHRIKHGNTRKSSFKDTPKDIVFLCPELDKIYNVPSVVKDIITNCEADEINNVCNTEEDKVSVTFLNSQILSQLNIDQGEGLHLMPLITPVDTTNTNETQEWVLIHSDDKIIGHRELDEEPEVLKSNTVIVTTLRKQSQNIEITLISLGYRIFTKLIGKLNSESCLNEEEAEQVTKTGSFLNCIQKLIKVLKQKTETEVQKFFKILKHKMETFVLGCNLDLVYNNYGKRSPAKKVSTGTQYQLDYSINVEAGVQNSDETVTVIDNRSGYEEQVINSKNVIKGVKKGCLVIDVQMNSKWELANLKRDIKCGMYAMRHCLWLKEQGKPIPQGPITVKLMEAGKVVVQNTCNIAEILAAEEREIEQVRLEQKKENQNARESERQVCTQADESVLMEETSGVEQISAEMENKLTFKPAEERKMQKNWYSYTADEWPVDPELPVFTKLMRGEKVDNMQWMRELPKETPLWSMSIPGIKGDPSCVNENLKAGIRFLTTDRLTDELEATLIESMKDLQEESVILLSHGIDASMDESLYKVQPYTTFDKICGKIANVNSGEAILTNDLTEVIKQSQNKELKWDRKLFIMKLEEHHLQHLKRLECLGFVTVDDFQHTIPMIIKTNVSCFINGDKRLVPLRYLNGLMISRKISDGKNPHNLALSLEAQNIIAVLRTLDENSLSSLLNKLYSDSVIKQLEKRYQVKSDNIEECINNLTLCIQKKNELTIQEFLQKLQNNKETFALACHIDYVIQYCSHIYEVELHKPANVHSAQLTISGQTYAPVHKALANIKEFFKKVLKIDDPGNILLEGNNEIHIDNLDDWNLQNLVRDVKLGITAYRYRAWLTKNSEETPKQGDVKLVLRQGETIVAEYIEIELETVDQQRDRQQEPKKQGTDEKIKYIDESVIEKNISSNYWSRLPNCIIALEWQNILRVLSHADRGVLFDIIEKMGKPPVLTADEIKQLKETFKTVGIEETIDDFLGMIQEKNTFGIIYFVAMFFHHESTILLGRYIRHLVTKYKVSQVQNEPAPSVAMQGQFDVHDVSREIAGVGSNVSAQLSQQHGQHLMLSGQTYQTQSSLENQMPLDYMYHQLSLLGDVQTRDLASQDFPTTLQIHKLAEKIGMEKDQLAAYMGIRPQEVEQIEYDNPCNIHNQIYQILLRWRDRNQQDAAERSVLLQSYMRRIGKERLANFVEELYKEYKWEATIISERQVLIRQLRILLESLSQCISQSSPFTVKEQMEVPYL